MARILFVALIASLGAAAGVETKRFNFAEAFTSGAGQALQIGYRVFTAPMLTDISASGILVERLEVWPEEIRVKGGASFSLQHLQITAFGPDGNVAERVPLTLDLEGPAELLEFEEFITYGHDIRATRSGVATIWVTSVLPATGGEYASGSIRLVVR